MVWAYFFGKKKIQEFENILKQNEYKKDLNNFLKESVFIGTVFFIANILVLLFIKSSELFLITVPFVFFGLGFLLNFFAQFYLFDYKRKTIEKFVPDLLLSASIFPTGTNLNKIIEQFSKTNYRFLSKEFEKCNDEILKGSPPVEALKNLKKRNNSVVLNRAIDIIISGVSSGADVSQVFKDTAADLFDTASILRERVASLTIEKYTLLFAGGLIVPAILGTIIAIVSGLNFDSLSELEIGLSAVERKELVQAALFASPIYIIEYAIIASFFVAFQEGDLKKGLIYSLVLVPASLGVYYFVPHLL